MTIKLDAVTTPGTCAKCGASMEFYVVMLCDACMDKRLQKNVLVDVDDTISDTQRHILEWMAEQGAHYEFEQITRDFRERGRDTDPEYERLIRHALDENPELLAATKPYDDALLAFRELRDYDFTIHIVSSRQTPLHDVTAQWIRDHGFLPHVEQIHPRPPGVKGNAFKRSIADEQLFVAAFDDTFEVCTELAAADPGCQVYLIDKPWNRGYDSELPRNVKRVDSFSAGVDDLLKWPREKREKYGYSPCRDMVRRV